MLTTTRTYRAKIGNHQQVSDDLDYCGFSASKLWNVAGESVTRTAWSAGYTSAICAV